MYTSCDKEFLEIGFRTPIKTTMLNLYMLIK